VPIVSASAMLRLSHCSCVVGAGVSVNRRLSAWRGGRGLLGSVSVNARACSLVSGVCEVESESGNGCMSVSVIASQSMIGHVWCVSQALQSVCSCGPCCESVNGWSSSSRRNRCGRLEMQRGPVKRERWVWACF